VNWTHRVGGRLWQGRFFSCPLDERHSLAAVRYVECNPVRAGLVDRAESYCWSSAACHVTGTKDLLVSGQWRAETGIDDWSAWLREGVSQEVMQRLRSCTRRGRPLGNDSFIARLELVCNRILRPRKSGRPRKSIA
jgi:putative transposase